MKLPPQSCLLTPQLHHRFLQQDLSLLSHEAVTVKNQQLVLVPSFSQSLSLWRRPDPDTFRHGGDFLKMDLPSAPPSSDFSLLSSSCFLLFCLHGDEPGTGPSDSLTSDDPSHYCETSNANSVGFKGGRFYFPVLL